MAKNLPDKTMLENLRSAAGSGPVLILTHDNPDPDALASGKGLSTLFWQAWRIPSKLIYSGLVGRAENRAMLVNLTPEWEHQEDLPDFNRYSAVALIDTQPGRNNRYPDRLVPDIVIDHHPIIQSQLEGVRYVDVRSDLGATASLVYQYLEAAGLIPDPDLATALFYGLQTDTRGLARGSTPADEEIYIKLLSWIDRKKLNMVDQAGLSRAYFSAMSYGLKAARVYKRSVFAFLGEIHWPDLAAEIADELIRLDTAKAALCIGVHDGYMHLSLRTTPLGLDAGSLIQGIVQGFGNAGGHGTMAGGQILLEGRDQNQLAQDLEQRFLSLVGETDAGTPLL